MVTWGFVRGLRNEGYNGDARLYKLSKPVKYGHDYEGDTGGTTQYVVVSAVSAMFSGPETYIFPANEAGKVIDWGEMPGSFRGSFDHERALREAEWREVEEEGA